MAKRAKRGYKPFEARLIQLLRQRFEAAHWKVEDHLKVGKMPLEIDLVVHDPAQHEPALLPKLFEYFRQHNIFEVKTEEDSLTPEDLLKVQGYVWLYLAKEKNFSFAEVTATALAHHLTPVVQQSLSALGYEPLAQGIWRRSSDWPSYLISFKDLPDELTPEELQIFSNPERRKKVFVNAMDRQGQKPLLDAIIQLYENEAIKLMALLDIKPESMPKFIDALGRKKVIAALQEKDTDLAALLDIKPESMPKFIDALGRKKVIAALQEQDTDLAALLDIKPESMPKFIDALGREKILAALNKNDMLAALNKNDILAALGDEDLLAAFKQKEHLLKTLLASLSPEQLSPKPASDQPN